MNFAREEAIKISLSVIGDIWRFPGWWYGRGAKEVGGWCWQQIRDTWERLAIALFVKYFFKPMYGDYTWSGRIISIFMRFVLIIVKLVRLVFWFLFYTLAFILWLVILPLALVLIFV